MGYFVVGFSFGMVFLLLVSFFGWNIAILGAESAAVDKCGDVGIKKYQVTYTRERNVKAICNDDIEIIFTFNTDK